MAENVNAEESQAAPETPDTTTDPQDRIYEDAAHLLEDSLDNSAAPASGKGPDQPADETPTQHEADPLDESDTGETPQAGELTPEQTQLLSRLHMTPEQLAGWTDEQRSEFLANAAKREADQTSTYNDLKNRLQALEKGTKKESGDETRDADDSGAADDAGADEADGELADVVGELVDNYGDEIKPLGDLAIKLNQQVGKLNEALEQQQARNFALGRLLSEQATHSAIRELSSEYPSLNKAEARVKVMERFTQQWRSDSNPHRKEGASMMDQITGTMRDAAAAEFGNVTESAAQVALANRTKERLRSQPQAGQGRNRPQPKSEDDLYDEAFEKHLANDL